MKGEGKMNKGGFSWKRALGVTKVKQNISRKIGIPLTRSGRQRKAGAAAGCCVVLIIPIFIVGISYILLKVI
jgi:hypothetical protein